MTEEEKKKRKLTLDLLQGKKIDNRSLTQKGSDLLRGLGLGAVSDIGAGVFEAGRAATSALGINKNAYKMEQGKAVQQNPFATQEQITKRSTLGGATEQTGRNLAGLASWAIPFGKGLGIGQLTARAAGAGGLSTLSQPDTGVKSMLAGAGLSLGLAGTTKGASNLIKGVVGDAPRYIKQLFNAPEPIRKLEGKTKLNFANEFVKRDLPNIAGKNIDDINTYFQEAFLNVSNSADEFLRTTGKTAKQSDILKIIDDEITKLNPRKGRVLQSEGIKKLQVLRNEVLTAGKEFGLDTINQFKRDAAREGKAAFGPSGTASAASNALDSIQSALDKFIESKASGYKDINKTIQYYKTASEIIAKKAAKPSRFGLFDILGAGGAAGATMFGGPLAGAVVATPYIGKKIMDTSQFQTKAAQLAPQIIKDRIPQTISDPLQRLLFKGVGQGAGGLFSGQRQTDQVSTQQPLASTLGVSRQPQQPLAEQSQIPQPGQAVGGKTMEEWIAVNGEGYPSPDGQWMWSAKQNDWIPNPEAQAAAQDTPASLTQEALALSRAGRTKEADQLLQVAAALRQNQPAGEKPLGATAAQRITFADSGQRGLKEAMTLLEKDPDILIKQLVPGKFFSRKFDSTLFRAVENLLRAKTGAAAPEEEVRRYVNKFGPTFGDSPAIAKYKLEQMFLDLEDVRESSGKISTADDYLQNIYSGTTEY